MNEELGWNADDYILLKEIIQKLQFNQEEEYFFEEGWMKKPTFSSTKNHVEAELFLNRPLPFSLYFKLNQSLNQFLNVPVLITIHTKEQFIGISELQKYISHFIEIERIFELEEVIFVSKENEINGLCADIEGVEEANSKKELILDLLRKVGIELTINFVVGETKVIDEAVKLPERPKFEPTPVKEDYRKKRSKREYLKIAIHDITDSCENIMIEGKIFKMESIVIRSTGKIIQTLYIHDADDAIVMKRFEGHSVSKEELESIHEGDYVLAKGDVQYDRFSRDLVLNVKEIEPTTNPTELSDTAVEKRIELHAHTNKSEMDGISSATELVEQAYRWGHEAVAITDHMVVQAFPEAQAASKNLNKKDKDKQIKVIYGIEMNLVPDQLKIISGNLEEIISDDYVVFDLETTGLSNEFDYIIEFGAVKIQNGDIVSSLQMFIQPPVELSSFTTELTGIQQADVDGAKTIEEELKRILDFIGNSTLVAHNAEFDIGFLQSALKKHGFPKLENSVIDSLNLARTLHTDRRAYRLGNVARYYGIVYDEDVAHRADYDAKILTQVFLRMMDEVRQRECKTLGDIQNLQDFSIFKKAVKKHVNLLVKNSIGLKDLFHLVTLSHTQYLAVFNKANTKSDGDEFVAEPRITKSMINQYRQDLLVGSSCYNGEIFEIASNRSLEELEEAMSWYDYIEVQPIDNYRSLINSGSIVNEERLIMVLTRIITTAKKLNKIIVATGDVHYIKKEDKILRDIYINAQGIGGVRHPLYIYNSQRRKNAVAPDQHFRTTDEMFKQFNYLEDELARELIVVNPKKISDQIEQVFPVKSELYTPSIEGADDKLRELCYQTAREIYGNDLPELVEKRLEKELQSIIGHGFGVIYYISHLLVQESLRNGYLVGSRGSVGSSFVATMSKITEVNPLPPHYVCPNCQHSEFLEAGEVGSGYDLPNKECPKCGTKMHGDGQDIPFETFLGFEGDKVPDIDLNFSGDFQEHAHAYTKVIFGEDYVYRAGTIGTVAQKTAFGYVSGYSEEKGLENMRQAMRLRLAMGCEGVKRTTGQHPGGIIVIPKEMDVHDFTPVQYPANNIQSDWKTTHFEFGDIHDNVLKLDILGHVDPTAMKLLEEISGIDVTTIPMNDEKVMSIFNSVQALEIDDRTYREKTGALGLPEFGTQFVRRILEATRPTTFSDLLRISGLSHGTDVWANNAQNLIQQGKTLNDVIGCRDDIMVYLIQKGLKPKEAFDIMESVRKGRGLREEWITLMKEHQVPNWYIDSCEKIKYMFPKAHAVAYVMMAVRVAWFKVYYPNYYYISFFTLRCNAYDIDTMIKGKEAVSARLNDIQTRLADNEQKRLVTNKEIELVTTLEVCLEMYLRGYSFSNIRLDESLATTFLVDKDNPKCIIPPFTTIDGLGANVATSVVEARKNRPFLSKQDLINRTQLSTTLLKKLEQLGVVNHLQEENQMSLF